MKSLMEKINGKKITEKLKVAIKNRATQNKKIFYDDGITFDTEFAHTKTINPSTYFPIQLCLILFCLYGTVFTLVSGLSMPVKTKPILILMLVATICFHLTHLAKKKGLVGLIFLLGVYISSGYFMWNKLQNGFWHLENIYISHINEYFNSKISYYIVDEYDESQVITIFLCFVVVILAFLICQSILGKLPHFIMLLVTAPFLMLPLVVGKIPNTIPFAAYVMSVCGSIGLNKGMQFGKNYFHKKRKNNLGKHFFRYKQLQYRIGLKSGFIIFLIVGILFIMLPIFIPGRFYNSLNIPTKRIKIQKAMNEYEPFEVLNDLNNHFFPNINILPFGSGSSGGLSKGELGKIGQVQYKNETALKVQITGKPTTTYLKAFTGSVYDGDSWNEFDETAQTHFRSFLNDNTNPIPISNMGSFLLDQFYSETTDVTTLNEEFGVEYIMQNINIKTVKASKNSVYVPSLAIVPESRNYDNNHEPYVKAKRKLKEYEFRYFNVGNDLVFLHINWEDAFLNLLRKYNNGIIINENMINAINYYNYEKKYRKIVYQYYLQVPDEGLERLKEATHGITYEELKKEYGTEALPMLVSAVIDFIQRDTKYTLAPGTLPEGKDFVDYFLYENKLGYCMHYASSAAITLRLMGVPTRYVEGYVVKQKDFTSGEKIRNSNVPFVAGIEQGLKSVDTYEMKIKDSNAHAWIEVYVDGFGWVPVEVTPANYQEDTEAEQTENKEKITSTPTPKPTNTPTPSPKPTQKVEPTSTPTSGHMNQDKTVKSTKNHNHISQIAKNTAIVIASILLLASTPLIISTCIRNSRVKRIRNKNNSEKALFSFELMAKLLDYYKLDTEKLNYNEIGQQLHERYEEIEKENFRKYMEIIEKAKFSHNLIMDNELKYVLYFYKSLLAYHYRNKPWYKRLYYKYIKVF